MAKRLSSLASFLRAKRYLKWRITALVLIGLILASRMVAWFMLDQTNAQAAKQNLELVTEQQIRDTQRQFEIYANTLYAARGLYSTGDAVTRQGWEAFVDAQALHQRYPAFYALGYISVIHQADVVKLTAQLNTNRLTGETTPVVIRPVTGDDTLGVLTFIAPSTAPQTNIGYNVLADATRAQALAEARDTGLPRASKPLSIIADTPGKPPSILIVLPIYAANANSLQTVAQRRAALQGYVAAALRTKPMLDGIFANATDSGLHVSVTTNGNTLYQYGPELSGPTLEQRQDVSVSGQVWTFDFKAAPNIGVSTVAQIAPILLSLSVLPFLLVVALILYFATRVHQPAARNQDGQMPTL